MKPLLSIFFIILFNTNSICQTEIDGLQMNKNLFCIGINYENMNWKNYWEGRFKRNNQNLGTVSKASVILNGNYGITNKLNIIFSLPYIKSHASAGQLAGQHGLQDISFYLKWVAMKKKFKKGVFSAIAVGGLSSPTTNYTPDLLPLSIGMQSKTTSIRTMADYQYKNWFATFSGTYIYRGNVTLDRNTYYTTQLHYTNKVFMPNVFNFNFRLGSRTNNWIFEAYANQWLTKGGFDISKNNMPFVSNKMNATTIGLHVKYLTKFVNGLSFNLDGITTIKGRNVGQSSGYNGGVFYIINLNKKTKVIKK